MEGFYYATITYPSGDEVRLVHKGREPTKGTMALLGRIGAIFEIGDEVPADVQREAEVAGLAIAGVRRLTANAQFNDPSDDED